MLETSNILPQIEGNHDCMLWICKIIIFQVKMVYLCKQPVWIFGRVHSQNQEHPEGTCLRRRQESQHCLKARFFYKFDGLTWLRANVTIICCNEELSPTMSWVGCLLPDSELFILSAENSKISVIPILLTFMYLVALNLLVNNQLNSLLKSTHHCSLLHIIVT